MKACPKFVLALLAGLGLMAMASPGEAQQISNRPFNFSRGGGTGGGMGPAGVGMSTAYRQMILEQEVLGRQPNNPILRDSSGALVDVTRFNDQAFVSAQPAPFLVPQRGLGFSGGGLGAAPVMLGVGGGYAFYGRHDLVWISALYGGGQMATGYPSDEIDSWMYQLHGLRFES